MPFSALTAQPPAVGSFLPTRNPMPLDEWLVKRASEWASAVSIRRNSSATTTQSPQTERLSLARSSDDVIALPPISREDLEAHRGDWVLLRAGRVIDHGQDPDALLQDHRAGLAEFTLYLVPASDRRFH